MVEFLIIAMALLMLILGTIQFALIYQAKITLNYAAFETARAGAVDNARRWATELAFARALAPLYTNPYLVEKNKTAFGGVLSSGSNFTNLSCGTNFALGALATPDLKYEHVKCAREHVREMIVGKQVRILLVNPGPEAFAGRLAVATGGGKSLIPNDNLMYRSKVPDPNSGQSIQDANLIKVHIGLCYKLVVPLVDRMIARMVALAPTALEPANFGPAAAGSFAHQCSAAGLGPGVYGVPIYAHAVMRMQSDPIEDRFCSGQRS